jgi:hypothetical protein
MAFDQGLLVSFGGTFSRSFSIDLGLTNSICQLTMGDFGDIEGGNAQTQITWVDVSFLDPSGKFHLRNLGDASLIFDELHSFGQNHALRATYLVKVRGHAYVSWIVNKFFWDDPVS